MKVEVGGTSYYMNKHLKAMWDNIKDGKLKKLDEDRVYIIDGRERSGKSLFSIQQAAYIDPSILNDLSRITFTTEDTLKAIRNTVSTNTETKVVIFDEAFRGLSSKSAISKVNKQIVQALMEMGQSNIVLFLNSPSFFLLETYPAVLRSSALFHIEKVKKSRKRFFKGYNEEKKGDLYRIGLRKGWKYNVKTNFRDWFFEKYPGGDDFERRYRAKKYKSLRDMGSFEDDQKEMFTPIELLIINYRLKHNLSEKAMESWCKEHNYPLSASTIGNLTRKYIENTEKLHTLNT